MPGWKSGLVAVGSFLLGSSLGYWLLNQGIEAWTRRASLEGRGGDAPGIGTAGFLLLPFVLVIGGVLGLLLASLLRKNGFGAAVPYLAAAGWLLFVVGFFRLMG